MLFRSPPHFPEPAFRSKKVGGWTDADFARECATTATFDISDAWCGAGPYVLTFEYRGGLHGVRIMKLDCIAVAPDGTETVLDETASAAEGNKPAGDTNSAGMVNVYEPWREVRFQFPKIPRHATPRIRVRIELLEQAPPEQRLSKGDILLRRGLSK